MSGRCKTFCVLILFASILAFPAFPQTTDPALQEVKQQLQQATEALKRQQEVIEALQKRVGELEAKQAEGAQPKQAPQAPPPAQQPDLASKSEKKAAAEPFKAAWKEGQSLFTFPKAEIRLANRMQLRWSQFEFGEKDQINMGEFRVRRFKVQATGWAYTPDLTFGLQVDLANANNSLGILDDAFVDYDFTRGKGYFHLRAGQFKVPFGRQTIASTKTDMFIDRSFVTYLFSDIRDVGIMAWGQFGPEGRKDLVEYRAGLFNGGGRSEYTNKDGKYQTDLRLMVSPWGSAGYDEANPFGSEDPKLSLGVEYEYGDRRRDKTGWMAGFQYTTLGYDLMFKYKRFTAYGEYFDRRSYDQVGSRKDTDGINAQLGFLLLPKRWEVFLGYWSYDPDKIGTGNLLKEVGIGANWYFSGFNSKLQADYRRIKNEKNPWNNYELRVQYQIVF